jgi:lysophospholipase L1-like esterase
MTEGVVSPVAALTALTAGLPQSYPFQLQILMAARYTNQTVTVLNAGLAGRKATEDRTRFNTALSDAKPELLLLLEGANDLGNGIGVTTTVNAMEDMVRDAGGRGVRVMLATLPPSRVGGRLALAPDTLRRYNDGLKLMAAKKGAQVVDVNTLLPLSFIGQDGLHLTDEGYQRLAEIFMNAIKAGYEAAPAAAAR